MKLLSNFFGRAICGSLKAYFNITYVEQAQALNDRDLLRARAVGKKFIEKLRSIPPDEDAPLNRHKVPLPLWIGTLVYAIEQLPSAAKVRNDQEHKVKVVQDGVHMELVFKKEEKHHWKWQLVAIDTLQV